jgi:hypothetical protein
MSRRALHLATRDLIRSQLGYTAAQADVTFDGQPPPRCGKIFVGVHRGARDSSLRTGQEIAYQMQITLTGRVEVPYDRIGTDLMEKAMMGLDERSDAIIDLIHEDASHKLLAAINAYIVQAHNQGTAQQEFTEPPSFLGDDGGRMVGGPWFHAAPEAIEMGVALTLRFGKALRIKRMEDLGLADPNM